MYRIASVVHISSAIAALAFGAVVLVLRKGTRIHKMLGYAYAGSMLGVDLSAFLIYRLFGHFGAFHIAAVFSLLTIIAGVLPVLWRRPLTNYRELHYQFMSWSYVGLVAAAFAEVATRSLPIPIGLAVGLSMTPIFIIGGVIIARHRTIIWRIE